MIKHIKHRNCVRQRLLKKKVITKRQCWRRMTFYSASISLKKAPQAQYMLVFSFCGCFLYFFGMPFSCLNQVVCIHMLFINHSLFSWSENAFLVFLLELFSISTFVKLIIILAYMLHHFDGLFLVQFSDLKSSYLITIHNYLKNTHHGEATMKCLFGLLSNN